MSDERNIRNYAAGAALSFGVVLFTFQLTAILLSGKTPDELQQLNDLLFTLFVGVHTVGGLVGSFLVARRVSSEHTQTGIVTVILGYVFENLYFFVFGDRQIADVWVLLSLLLGGILGAQFAKTWRVRHGLEIDGGEEPGPADQK